MESKIIIKYDDLNRFDRVLSCINAINKKNPEFIEYIISIKDHEGNLDIECKPMNSKQIYKYYKLCLEIWESYGESTIWLDSDYILSEHTQKKWNMIKEAFKKIDSL
jgi:hypothetical protein